MIKKETIKKVTIKKVGAKAKNSALQDINAPAEMAGNVIIVGTGPGSALQLTHAAEEAALSADIIIASSKKIASAFSARKSGAKKAITITPVHEVDYVKIRSSVLSGKTVCFLVSGDPGLFSLAKMLRNQLEDLRVITIPAISSIQYFASKLNVEWQNVPVISFHGRKKFVSAEISSDKYFVLLGSAKDAADLRRIFKGHAVVIGTDLSLKSEAIKTYKDVAALRDMPEGLSIAYIKKASAPAGSDLTIYGVGLGPGDPELLTIKALKRLRLASKIFYPISKVLRKSVAKDILDNFDLGETHLVPLLFPMSDDEQVLQSHWDLAAAMIIAEMAIAPAEEARSAAFVTIGDPLIYSTFIYLREAIMRVDPSVKFEIIPGITAFTVVAAGAQLPVVEKREDALIFPYRPGSSVSSALKKASTVVIYKAGRHIGDILKEIPIGHQVVLGLDLGKKGQKVVTDRREIEAISRDNKSYLATMIVKRPTAKNAGRSAVKVVRKSAGSAKDTAGSRPTAKRKKP